MVYFVIANKISIKPEFKKDDGELVFNPEVGLGEEQKGEPQISIPYFIKDKEDILGAYKLRNDGFFHKIRGDADEDGIVTIEIGRQWGDPRFQFKAAGIQVTLYLPSIQLMNRERQLLYAFFYFSEKVAGLGRKLKNYLEIKSFETVSFNLTALNNFCDDAVREKLNLPVKIEEGTGFTRKTKVTEDHRLQLKKEVSFIELFKVIINFLEKKSKFESEIEVAKIIAKALKERDEKSED